MWKKPENGQEPLRSEQEWEKQLGVSSLQPPAKDAPQSHPPRAGR